MNQRWYQLSYWALITEGNGREISPTTFFIAFGIFLVLFLVIAYLNIKNKK